MQPSNEVERLVEIMRALRDPDTGCPWDIEQSFDTIVPYTIEETFEVVDAIERRDAEDLREELGDLLLQVVYFAQLASEERLFDFADVVTTVTTKMIRRHPHVFGDAAARDARSAKGQWERIKAEEKAERAARRTARLADPEASGEWSGGSQPASRSLLDTVPGTLPAMAQSLKLQAKAAEVGFDWTTIPPILDKVREELSELDEAIEGGGRSEQEGELGDVLFGLVNLARRLEIDPDRALRRTIAKFRTRFAYVERALERSGLGVADADLGTMEAFWQDAKRRTD